MMDWSMMSVTSRSPISALGAARRECDGLRIPALTMQEDEFGVAGSRSGGRMTEQLSPGGSVNEKAYSSSRNKRAVGCRWRMAQSWKKANE